MTTRYAICDPCYRNPPKSEKHGLGDPQALIELLQKYEDAAQERLKATVKIYSDKDYDQDELEAILEG